MKKTGKTLLASALSLMLCIAMLVGTTFAWFTDSVSSGNNQIVAGNLDIELYHTNRTKTDEQVSPSTVLFDDVDSTKWEPGATAWEKFTVKNEGNLKLKYKLILNVLNASEIDDISFASMLKVAVVDSNFIYTPENVAALDASAWTDLASFSKIGNGELQKDETAVYGVIIRWEPSANDNVFNMNNGRSDTVKVDVSVSLVATQAMNEEDSFDATYDENAEFPLFTSAAQTLPAASAAFEDLNFAIAGENPVYATLPAALASDLADSGVTSATLRASEANVNDAEGTISFKEIAFFDQNGQKLDLSSNTTPIPVKFFVGEAFIGRTVSIFHDDAFVAAVEVDANGYIAYEALHFCEVFVDANAGYEFVSNGVYKNGNAYYLSNTAGLAWMNEHADDNPNGIFLPFFAGKTIYLMNDIDCEGFEMKATRFFQPESRTVFDGQGYTLYNVDISSASSQNSQAMFNGTVNIQNLNVDGAWVQGNGYTAVLGGQLYGNIDNCTVKNAQVFGSYWMAGVLAAQFNSGNITNCTVEDSEVYAPSAAGILAGVVNESASIRTIENCVIKNCTVEQNGGFGGDYDLMFGVAVGLINIQNTEVHFNNVTVEGNIVKDEASTVLFGLSETAVYQDGNALYTPVAAASVDGENGLVAEPTPLA